MSIANLTFFGVHWLFLLGVRRSSDLRLVLHTSLWPLKLLGWAGLTAAFFAVPSAAVYGYAQAARVLGGAYLVLQLVSLLDFLYRLNGALLDRDGCARGLLVALTAAAYATALTAIGIMYYLFAPRASCSLNIFLITFTLLLGLALTGVSVMPNRMQESGLFTAGAVFLYAAFLCFSALNSEPNSQGVCERAAGTQDAWITVRRPLPRPHTAEHQTGFCHRPPTIIMPRVSTIPRGIVAPRHPRRTHALACWYAPLLSVISSPSIQTGAPNNEDQRTAPVWRQCAGHRVVGA